MGDFVLTCNSPQSRNFRFGMLLAEGLTSAAAETQIGMVIEGAYTCRSVLQLSSKMGIAMPVTEAVHKIIDGELTPLEAVRSLMLRAIKEEHL
jgi:glycerol-3-phosphate dehydrogenase (NAD(P)+)